MATVHPLLSGFPGRSSRGFLGWSSCYLVSTAGGRRVMFDTAGYNERATVIDSLSKLGVAPESINLVVLSHLHFDHAANWDLFPSAEIIVHERELAYADSQAADIAVLRYHAPILRVQSRLHAVSAEIVLEEDVRVVHVPGHTPGCIALQVGNEVLCGDALKSRWDLQGHMAPPVWDPELAAGEWRSCGSPTVRVFFPDGSEQVVAPPKL
jgi:N-acyl homoserine lactone hydrolase